jgi:UDP-N-acetylmuramoylalanine--D-glutamate ligase
LKGFGTNLYRGKKIALVGFGIENKAAFTYFKNRGAIITIHDQTEDLKTPPEIKTVLGKEYLNGLDAYDLVVRSPSIPPEKLVESKALTTAVKEFFANCPATIIGITGTKGKGTTATLMAKMLEIDGKSVYLGGNIGVPVLSFLDKLKPQDYVVLELSSYQLADLNKSPHIAVCLAISTDHLAFHGNQETYVEAKTNIFRYQEVTDVAVYHKLNPESARAATYSLGQKRPYFDKSWANIEGGWIWLGEQKICRTSDVGLLGAHNLENIAAAINAVGDLVNDSTVLVKVIQEFKGLPHRLEPVSNINERLFINDSFASAPEATIAAINSFNTGKVLIWGGYDKSLDYKKSAKAISETNVSRVVLIGQTADRMKQELEICGYQKATIVRGDIKDIVKAAYEKSQPGDVILFSPGASSFDMFKNFEDRGDQFKQVVKSFKS